MRQRDKKHQERIGRVGDAVNTCFHPLEPENNRQPSEHRHYVPQSTPGEDVDLETVTRRVDQQAR